MGKQAKSKRDRQPKRAVKNSTSNIPQHATIVKDDFSREECVQEVQVLTNIAGVVPESSYAHLATEWIRASKPIKISTRLRKGIAQAIAAHANSSGSARFEAREELRKWACFVWLSDVHGGSPFYERVATAAAGCAYFGLLTEFMQLETVFPRTMLLYANPFGLMQPIHYASQNGKLKFLRHLLCHGVSSTECNLAGKDGQEMRPIHLASLAGHVDIIEALMLADSSNARITAAGMTALQCAVKAENIAAMRALLRHPDLCSENVLHVACAMDVPKVFPRLLDSFDVDLTDCTTEGLNAMHVACASGSLGVVDLLLNEYNIPPDVPCSCLGRTPLQLACRHGHESVAHLLLDHGASLNLASKDGYTPLHMACGARQGDMVRFLLKHGSGRRKSRTKYPLHLTPRTEEGFEPLHLACQQGCVEIVRILVTSHQELVESRSSNTCAALHICCSHHNVELIRLLLPLVSDDMRNDALQYACATCRDPVIVALFLEHDASCCSYIRGWTPLHKACMHDNEEVVRMLLSQEYVSVMPRDDGHEAAMPIHVACDCGSYNSLRLLLNDARCGEVLGKLTKSGMSPLHIVCFKGHYGMAKMLLDDERVSPDIEDADGHTPLHRMCEIGRVDMVQLLLDRGARLDARTLQGWYPVHCACAGGQAKVLRLLMDTQWWRDNEPTGLRSVDGDTLLLLACQYGHTEVADIVLEYMACHGQSLDERNDAGAGPMHRACELGHEDVVRLLLRHTQRDERRHRQMHSAPLPNGEQPLHLACKGGHARIVSLLLKTPLDLRLSGTGGLSPLHYACVLGHEEIVSLLLADSRCTGMASARAACADDARIEIEFEPIQLACWRGSVNIVELLWPHYSANRPQYFAVADSTCPLSRDSTGAHHIDTHPFAIAARRGHPELVLWILSNHRDAIPTYAIERALGCACKTGQAEIVRCISDAGYPEGCDTSEASQALERMLHDACNSTRGVDTALALLPQGHDIIDHFSQAWTDPANAIGIWRCFLNQLDQRHGVGGVDDKDRIFPPKIRRILRGILEEVSAGNVPPHQLKRILEFIRDPIASISPDLLEQLNIEPRLRRDLRRMMDEVAAGSAPLDEFQRMLESIRKPLAAVNDGLLKQICIWGYVEALRCVTATEEYLFQRKDSETARRCLNSACKHGHPDMVEYFVSTVGVYPSWGQEADPWLDSPMATACKAGQLNVARCLSTCHGMSLGDSLPESPEMQYPLHLACTGGNLSLVQHILAQENVSAECRDLRRYQPLHVACEMGQTEIVHWLLRVAKVPPLELSISGHQPLHIAIQHGHHDTAQVLLEYQSERRALRAEFRWWVRKAHVAAKSRQNRIEGLKVQKLRPKWLHMGQCAGMLEERRLLTLLTAHVVEIRRRDSWNRIVKNAAAAWQCRILRSLRRFARVSPSHHGFLGKPFYRARETRLEKVMRENDAMQYELERLRAHVNRQCVVCLDSDRDAACMPCRHLACCYKCSELTKKCPICRTPVTTWEKFYLP